MFSLDEFQEILLSLANNLIDSLMNKENFLMKYASETWGNTYKKDKNVKCLVIKQATY